MALEPIVSARGVTKSFGPVAVLKGVDFDVMPSKVSVVIGPGSLFTSVMPNLLVPGIAQAIRQTSATRVYVANMATERGETDKFTLSDHVQALERHIGRNLIDAVIANNRIDPNFSPPSGVDMVLPEASLRNSTVRVIRADVADSERPWRHDPQKLANAVLHMIDV